MSYPNDNFASATVLTGGSGSLSLHYDGIGDPATSETGEDVYGAGETLWWKWTATSTGTAQVNTRFSPSDDSDPNGLDTKIRVLTDFTTVIRHNDDDPDPPSGSYDYNSYVEFDAVTGTTYWFMVDMYGPGQAGTLHLAWGSPPPPPPVSPGISAVHGDAPGRSFPPADTLFAGHTVTIDGDHLDVVDRVQLPGFTMLAADFLSQSASQITFTLPTTSGILSGPLRVAAGALHDDHDVTVLRPETSWHTPDPVSITGISTMIDTTTGHAARGRFKTVGSSRVGDGGTPSYNDDTFPPAKMGYDNGAILEQITAIGIDNGFSYTGMDADGYGVIPTMADMASNSPPEPPGPPDEWAWEYQGQPPDDIFGTNSPVPLKDALTAPVEMYVAVTPTWDIPRLSETSYDIYAQPASEATDTESAGLPDTHVTKLHAWFDPDNLLDSGTGPNYAGDWNDNFDPAAQPGWVAVSTALSHTSGFAGGGGLTATGAGEFRSPPVGATPTFHYRMDCWIGNAPAAGGTVQVGIAWLDEAGAQLSIDWGSSYSVDNGSFTNRTWVSVDAPDDPAIWSRQLVFQFSGCASLEIDSVNFRNDGGSYSLIRNLVIPDDALYLGDSDHLFVVLVGATGPGIVGTAEAGKLAYAMTGSTATAEYGAFQPRISYQPSSWRYWLPVAIGTLPPDTLPPLRQVGRADGSRQHPRAHVDGSRQTGRVP